MTDIAEVARRGRPPRTVEVQQERRRRTDTSVTGSLKMFVHPDAKDPNYEYRFFNDDGDRIYQKTVQDDWDIVTVDQMNGKHDPGKIAGSGTQVEYAAGKGEGGKGRKAILCRKPKQFYQSDKGKEQAAIRAQEDDMRRGPVAAQHGPQGLSRADAYVPGGADGMSGTNTIGQGLARG